MAAARPVRVSVAAPSRQQSEKLSSIDLQQQQHKQAAGERKRGDQQQQQQQRLAGNNGKQQQQQQVPKSEPAKGAGVSGGSDGLAISGSNLNSLHSSVNGPGVFIDLQRVEGVESAAKSQIEANQNRRVPLDELDSSVKQQQHQQQVTQLTGIVNMVENNKLDSNLSPLDSDDQLSGGETAAAASNKQVTTTSNEDATPDESPSPDDQRQVTRGDTIGVGGPASTGKGRWE